MIKNDNIQLTEIRHKDYNLDGKDNLEMLPVQNAVFGVFGIVNDEPVNCRYVGETDNLQESVRRLYEHPEGPGLTRFMQGPWIQMLCYQLVPDMPAAHRAVLADQWKSNYKPDIDEDGEYPGYY